MPEVSVRRPPVSTDVTDKLTYDRVGLAVKLSPERVIIIIADQAID